MLDRGEPGADLRPSFKLARIWRVASLWMAGATGEVGMDNEDIVGVEGVGVAGVGVAFIMY
jgi:hypothetical protein